MKKLIAVVVGVFGMIGGPSFAADFPPSGPPRAAPAPYVAPAAYNWSGFYVGVNAGYGMWDTATAAAAASDKGTGAIAGGQIGANWQIGMAVLGLEGDFQWSGQKETIAVGCGGCLTGAGEVSSFGTARARIGIAIDRVLLYATGGAAWTNGSEQVSLFGVNLATLSGSGTGWTVGGGIEGALLYGWTAKLEYLYISTSNISLKGTNLFGATVTDTVPQLNDSIFRFGINYKF